jgi:hypothetical protein
MGTAFTQKSHEQSRANRRTTNSGVCSTGTDGKDYYGIVEEICQLTFPGCKPLKPVLFKCHWLDPDQTQETKDVGLVEIRQSSVYDGEDVYNCGSTGHTSVLSLILVQNRRTFTRLGRCVQGIATR